MRPAGLVLVVCACAPHFAPPIRGLHAGMPGLVSGGVMEVGASIGGETYPVVFVPHVALGLSDRVALEAGFNGDFVLGGWAMGWGGARFTFEKGLGIARKLYADVELGTGYGVGGHGGAWTDDWKSNRAYGLYEGFGVGVRAAYFGFYLRGRVEEATAERSPLTLWPTAIVGFEVRVVHHLVFGAGAGLAAYWSQPDGWHPSWMYQAQLRYIFDVPR